MKRILETIKRKWAEYLLETFVIVIGILVAFFLNNWNQDRLENKARKEYLNRLQIDLIRDFEELTILHEAHEKRSLSAKNFNKYFNQPEIDPVTFDSLYWKLFHSDDFDENNNTFIDLINTGRLDLLSQNNLKSELLELYSTYEKLNSFEEHVSRDNIEYIYDPTMSLVNIEILLTKDDSEFSREFIKIASSNQIHNGFLLFDSNSMKLNDLFVSSLSQLGKLDSLIQMELDQSN